MAMADFGVLLSLVLAAATAKFSTALGINDVNFVFVCEVVDTLDSSSSLSSSSSSLSSSASSAVVRARPPALPPARPKASEMFGAFDVDVLT
uniref:Secreted protein n=1 Tax=Rhipicephalus appendiculatus TaxID=34631 RepID=A0A131YBV7_RHIAP